MDTIKASPLEEVPPPPPHRPLCSPLGLPKTSWKEKHKINTRALFVFFNLPDLTNTLTDLVSIKSFKVGDCVWPHH